MQTSNQASDVVFNQATQQFLRAIEKGRFYQGSKPRLRRLVAQQERSAFGTLSCYCCGKPLALATSTLEHIVPKSLGGHNKMSNFALSHAACNHARGNTFCPRSPVLFSDMLFELHSLQEHDKPH